MHILRSARSQAQQQLLQPLIAAGGLRAPDRKRPWTTPRSSLPVVSGGEVLAMDAGDGESVEVSVTRGKG